jgi:hypothetical protein
MVDITALVLNEDPCPYISLSDPQQAFPLSTQSPLTLFYLPSSLPFLSRHSQRLPKTPMVFVIHWEYIEQKLLAQHRTYAATS